MTADECQERASDCAAKAALSASEPVKLEFLKLAAQWRAMAVRVIFLGAVDEPPLAPAIAGESIRRLT